MQRSKIITFIPVLLLMMYAALEFGCRKDQDQQNPKIEIYSPVENEVFTIGDTIRIEGVASDETRLEHLRFTLTNLQYIVKDYSLSLTPQQNPQPFSVDYIISDHLPEGDYLIQVSASDGINIKYKYRPIRLQRYEHALTALLVITTGPGNGHSLHSIDTGTTSPVLRGSWPSEYAASAISHQNKQLYLAGRDVNGFYALDLEDFTVDFNLQHSGTPSLQYHESLLTVGDRFYIGLTEGFVKGYNKLAVQQYSATLSTGRKAVMMIHEPMNNLMISAEEGQTAPGSWVTMTHLSSGQGLKEYKLPDDFRVVSLVALNPFDVLIAGNLNGNSRLYVWNHSQNALTQVLELPGIPLHDLLPYTTDQFLLATQDEILIYRLNQLQPTLFFSHPGVKMLRKDLGSQTLLVAGSNTLAIYHLTQKTLQWQTTLPGTIRQVLLRY